VVHHIKKKPKKRAEPEDAESPAHSRQQSPSLVLEQVQVADYSSQASGQTKKKKKTASSKPSVSNASEMKLLIAGILENSPTGSLKLSQISERIALACGAPWNKKFKSNFGTLADFIKKNPEYFSVDSEESVSLVKDSSKLVFEDKQASRSRRKKKKPEAPAVLGSPRLEALDSENDDSVSESSDKPKLITPAVRPQMNKKSKRKSSSHRSVSVSRASLFLLSAVFAGLVSIGVYMLSLRDPDFFQIVFVIRDKLVDTWNSLVDKRG